MPPAYAPRAAHLFVVLLYLGCADPGTNTPVGDTLDDTGTTLDAPLFPELGDSQDAADSNTVTTLDTSTPESSGDGDQTDSGDSPETEDDAIADPCATANCTAPHRGVCAPDETAAAGHVCLCDAGFALDGDTCVSVACADERVRTLTTLYDMTPLPNTPNPVRTGFDPLLAGDRVRVVVEVERTAGTRALRLSVFTQRLAIDPASVRLNGAVDTNTTAPSERQAVATLGADFASGRLSFEAIVTADGAPAVALDARVFTDLNCQVAGSASGARMQLAGTRDPKTPGCVDMADVRSVQLTDAIPDKDTSTYEVRNGAFTDISSAHKILTQMTVCLERRDGRTVSLAGSADGTRPWTIDNFLLIERFATDPEAGPAARIAAWLTTSTGATAPGSFANNGGAIAIVKHASLPGDYTGSRTPSAFTFPAGVVQLDALMPVGERVWLRFTGLDTGVAGHLSRLFIVSAEPEEVVAECRSHLDCPRPDSTNGSAIAIRSGCIAGACVATPCGAGCPLGQRCLQGFCSDGCESAANCPTGSTCAAGRCVAPTPGVSEGECRDFLDCPSGEVCFFGRCEAGCFHPVNQNPTYGDNHAQYSLCRTRPEACPRCPNSTDRCWYNYCRQCELDAHCPAGQRCADFRCVP